MAVIDVVENKLFNLVNYVPKVHTQNLLEILLETIANRFCVWTSIGKGGI